MRAHALLALVLAGLATPVSAFAHGWSEQMRQELNAKTPGWLVVGAPIKAGPASEALDDQAVFRSVAGDSQATRDRVRIPSREIEIKVDYPISWYRGSSLSPDGSKLIINSGAESKVYEILPNGSHRKVDLRLPRVTYDDGPKGFITGWSWADNKTLLGEAEIDNEKGEFIEKRIYVFHMNESALSRIDVSALNLPSTEGLTVSKVGNDLTHLKIALGNSEFTVKADLKSAPKIEEDRGEEAAPALLPTPRSATPAPASSPQPATSVAQTPAVPVEHKSPVWPWVAGILALIVIVAVALKRRA